MNSLKLFVSLISFSIIIAFTSCKEHVKEETAGVDTLSAAALDPETVIASIKEIAFQGDTNYKLLVSPLFSFNNYYFHSECYFKNNIPLPVLISEKGDWGIFGTREANYLNQDELLFYAGIKEEIQNDVFEYSETHAYFKDEKLSFAEQRKCRGEDTLRKMNFVLLDKNDSVLIAWNYTPVVKKAEKLMDAALLKGDFSLIFKSVVETNGKTFAVFTTSHKKNPFESNLRIDSDELLKRIQSQSNLIGQTVEIKFHNDDQNDVLDDISLSKK